MKVQLNLYASLKRYQPQIVSEDSGQIEVQPGTTVRSLLRELEIPQDSIKIVFLNGALTKGDDPLQDGDRLGVFPPVAGG